MHFEIVVKNGHYPLIYKCSTAHEAFGCIESLLRHGIIHVTIDLDYIMKTLIEMKDEITLCHSNSSFNINYEEGEV